MSIFISYRRGLTQDIVDHLRHRLSESFEDVFQDIESIDPGVDFIERTNQALGRAQVVLVVIGPDWAEGGRLHSPKDFVRLEVEQALQRDDIIIIPVLVRDAPMPRESDLPESLRPLLRRNAMQLRSGKDFNFHASLLERAIEPHARKRQPGRWTNRNRVTLAGGAAAAAFAAILGMALHCNTPTRPNGAAGEEAGEAASKPPELTGSAAVVSGSSAIGSSGTEAVDAASPGAIDDTPAPDEPAATTAAAPSNTTSGGLGQRCSDGKCKGELECIKVSNRCRAVPLEVGAQCDADAQCDSTLCGPSNVCTALPGLAEGCDRGRCRAGLRCIGASNTCEQLPLQVGKKCDGADQCQTGLCNAARECATLPGRGAPCTDGRCASGMYCTSGSSGRCYMIGDSCSTGLKGACTQGRYKLVGEQLGCEAPKPSTETCSAGDEDCDGQENEAGAIGCRNYGFDRDGDGFFVDLSCECGSRGGKQPTPTPARLDPNDCVHSTSAWNTERMRACTGQGASFDCNHNGADEKRDQQLGSATGSFGQGCKLEKGWNVSIPPCGQEGDWLSDCSEVAGTINRKTTKKIQQCR
jgi:hypothetical protein